MNERKLYIFILLAFFISTIVILLSTSALAFDSVNNSVTQINKSSSITGITITQKVPFSKESLNEIIERESKQPTPVPQKKEIPLHKAPPPKLLHKPGNQPPDNNSQTTLMHEFTASPLAPALSNSFKGLSDDDTFIPPDTMGAAGPLHLVEITNEGIGVFDKSTGVLISNVSLQDFWSPLGTDTGQPDYNPFDPKVIYDQNSGRFILVTMGGTSSPGSWLMIAVSNTSDPTGTWYRWAIDADKDEGLQIFNNWADYPGFGVDGNYVYVTANMFDNDDNYQYSKVWVVPKTQLLNGYSDITWTEFRDPPGSWFTMQPAIVFGTSSTEYFVHENFSCPDPYLPCLALNSITFPNDKPTWSRVGDIVVNSYPGSDFPDAPQLGSSHLIDTGDYRLLNAVYRNGYLWTTHTVANSANTKTEVAWYQINPADARLSFPYGTPVQQGNISDANRWYYYPSIAVNSKGDVGIGFSGSSTSEYAGAYYTARNSSDAAGTMQAVGLLKSGLAPYYKTFRGSQNRWGDYSATVVDPDDNLTFWTVQEYANTPNAVDDLWGTWWGKFALSAKNPVAAFNISGYKINGSDGSGIAGWNITLTNASLNVTTSTDSTGFYKFIGLVNGTYNVTEETRPGFTNVTPRLQVVTISGNDSTKVNFTNKLIISAITFDTVSGSYPSIMGAHNGTLRLNQSINVSKMYTYPSPGTGGHSEYVRIWNSSGWSIEANWAGYTGDWHNITFSRPFILEADVTYNYTIRTGSYPQIIHSNNFSNNMGTITGSEFKDANGKRYSDWIPAIRLE